jgi:apolipoprotein N-acyltransferase
MNREYIRYFILALSGILMGLSRDNAWLFVFSLFALLPLIYYTVLSKSAFSAFISGIFYGFSYNMFCIYWIINTMVNYGGLSMMEAVFVLILLCIYLALFWGVFAMLIHHASKRGISIFILPGAWVLLEYVISFLFTGFPWTLLGYNWGRSLLFIQLLDIGGVYMLSFLLVFINVLLFRIWMEGSKRRDIALLIMTVSLISCYGFSRLTYFGRAEPADTKTIAMIQTNIDQGEKMDRRKRFEILDGMLAYLERFVTLETDLIVYPETAFNINIRDTGYFYNLINWARDNSKPVLAGTIDYRSEGGNILYFNASMFTEKGNYSFYHKIHLVPFGEYLPLANLPIIKNLRNIVPSDTDRGRDRTIFCDSSGFCFITPICFEIIFPEEVAGWASDNADAIITLTNDAWFGRTKASLQHFDKVIFRAVENRRPSLMLANTGVSGFVDITGRPYSMTGLFSEEIVVDRMHLYEKSKTLWNIIYKYNILFYIVLTLLPAYVKKPGETQNEI